MDLAKLKEPFPAEDIEWRMQKTGLKNGKPWGLCLAYVTSRAIMDRLDEVVGAEFWCNSFDPGPDGGILCGITIFVDDRFPMTKFDGAENTKVEEVKGGLSSAMKRAGVQWGIGRYLYKLTANFADFSDNGRFSSKIDGKWFKWNPPLLPVWALPSTVKPAQNLSKAVPFCKPVESPKPKSVAKRVEIQKTQFDPVEEKASRCIAAFANIGLFIERRDLESCIGMELSLFGDKEWKELRRHLKELKGLPEATRLTDACDVFNLEPGAMG